MPFYDANDAAIYYEISGAGRPLVMLHGYALNGLMWACQKPVLEKHYRIILIDLRGFGKSSCGSRWSTGVIADDVAGIINQLDLHDAAMLGFSMSGPVAFRVALRQPDKITSLVFVSSILPSAGREQSTNQIKLFNKEIEALTNGGIQEWADKTGLRTGPLVENIFKRNPQIAILWEDILARHNPDYLRSMLAGRSSAFPKTNWRDRLKEISQPTLIIAGAQDSKFVDASQYIHRAIPHSQLAIISGAGHMVNLEKPDEFNQAVINFLE